MTNSRKTQKQHRSAKCDQNQPLNMAGNSDQRSQIEIYQSIFSHFPDGIVTLSMTGEIIDCNEAILKHFGYKKEEVLHTHFTFFIPSENEEEMLEQFMTLLTGHSVQHDTEILHKDGHKIYTRITSRPILLDKQVVGMYSIIQDTSNIIEAHNEVVRIKDNLSSAQQVAKIGSWEFTVKTRKMFWSDQVFNIFGKPEWRQKPLSLESVFSLVHKKDRERFQSTLRGSIRTGETFELEYRFFRSDGEERIAYLKGDCVHVENGVTERIVGVIQDITTLRLAELSLKENMTQARVIYDSLDATIWSMDFVSKKMLFVSKGVEALTGIKRSVLKKDVRIWREVIHPNDQEIFDQMQQMLEQGEKIKHQYRIIHVSGDTRWVEDQTIPVFNDDGDLIRLDGIISDITERKRYEDHMEFIANRDHLTGLCNRRHFEQSLAITIERAKRHQSYFSVFYIDVDHFKATIDVLGHQTGDNVIKMIAQRLLRFSHSKGFAARMTGDEFVVCLYHPLSTQAVHDLANEFKGDIEKVMKVDGYEIRLTISIGISTFPLHGETPEALVKNADTALYHVKQEGKADWKIYNRQMKNDVDKLYEIGRDLKQAIDRKEMHLVFQPKVDARNAEIVGAEALSRWTHPKWGPISPAIFIPLAEQHGWIDELSNWVLSSVCELIKEASKAQQNIVPISVNVSPRWLLKASFTTKVKECINQCGISPHLIEFEITETHMIQNEKQVGKVMKELKSFGIRFALDDFGTGFSSVSHLSQLDIDILKIDRALIHNIRDFEKNQRIIEGLIYIAENLDIDVIVEGVETMEELDFLMQKDCTLIQGYIFSKPLEAVDFKNKLSVRKLYPLMQDV